MLVFVSTSAQLRFDERGELKIVQFTDAHLRQDREDQAQKTLERLRWIIELERPDVVVFTGDVVSYKHAALAWRKVLDTVAREGVSFVVLLGNHDLEFDLTAEDIATIVTSYPGSLNSASQGVLDDMAIEVLSSDGERVAALLYCLDSNDYSIIDGVKGYGWIEHEQIAWYRDISSRYRAINGGEPLPSYAFFHIPLPEYGEAVALGQSKLYGLRREKECAPELNSGMFHSMLEMGDVVATFVGHDHDNNYAIAHHGIALVYGHFSGDDTVYNNLYSGVRVIRLYEGERDFETWVRDYRRNHRGEYRDHLRFNARKGRFVEVSEHK